MQNSSTVLQKRSSSKSFSEFETVENNTTQPDTEFDASDAFSSTVFSLDSFLSKSEILDDELEASMLEFENMDVSYSSQVPSHFLPQFHQEFAKILIDAQEFVFQDFSEFTEQPGLLDVLPVSLLSQVPCLSSQHPVPVSRVLSEIYASSELASHLFSFFFEFYNSSLLIQNLDFSMFANTDLFPPTQVKALIQDFRNSLFTHRSFQTSNVSFWRIFDFHVSLLVSAEMLRRLENPSEAIPALQASVSEDNVLLSFASAFYTGSVKEVEAHISALSLPSAQSFSPEELDAAVSVFSDPLNLQYQGFKLSTLLPFFIQVSPLLELAKSSVAVSASDFELLKEKQPSLSSFTFDDVSKTVLLPPGFISVSGVTLGPSLTFLSSLARYALNLALNGLYAPVLRKAPSTVQHGSEPDSETVSYKVSYVPALVDEDLINSFAFSIPPVLQLPAPKQPFDPFVRMVLSFFVDALVFEGVSHTTLPSFPRGKLNSEPRVTDALFASLNGTVFNAVSKAGDEVSRRFASWQRPITSSSYPRLSLHLLSPQAAALEFETPELANSSSWFLRARASKEGVPKVLHSQVKKHVSHEFDVTSQDPLETVLAAAPSVFKEHLRREIRRLEVLYPAFTSTRTQKSYVLELSSSEALEFASQAAPVLSASGFQLFMPKFSPLKTSVSFAAEFSKATDLVGGAHGSFTDVNWGLLIGDKELSLKELSALAKSSAPLVETSQGWVSVDEGQLSSYIDQLSLLSSEKFSQTDMLRLSLGLDHRFETEISLQGSSWVSSLLQRSKALSEMSSTDLESVNRSLSKQGFSASLRPYQLEALLWLDFLYEHSLGGVLALDMGLGKTPTLISHLCNTSSRSNSSVSLVLAPPAVASNWVSELEKFAPHLRVLLHHGPNRSQPEDLLALLGGNSSQNSNQFPAKNSKYDVVVTTYGTLLRDIEVFEKPVFDRFVLDEAQIAKNPSSQIFQSLLRVSASSSFILTGTPVENSPSDLWSLLQVANPGLLGSLPDFNKAVAKLAASSSQSQSALSRLNGLFVFRRSKNDPVISSSLPDRQDIVEKCALTSEQLGLYKAVLEKLRDKSNSGSLNQAHVLSTITALKQICNHPASFLKEEISDPALLLGRSGKLDRLLEVLDEIFASNERALIFTHFASWGVTLSNLLTSLNRSRWQEFDVASSQVYHGGMSRTQRDQVISEFQNSSKPSALVLSLKAGGTGLNLTNANNVILFDRWWNPAIEDQARDRAWRIGQNSKVVARKLVCPGSVDDRVEQIVGSKRQVAQLLLPKSSSLSDLDFSDLNSVLGLSSEVIFADET